MMKCHDDHLEERDASAELEFTEFKGGSYDADQQQQARQNARGDKAEWWGALEHSRREAFGRSRLLRGLG